MPKRAQIRALPTLGHGEGLSLCGVNCSSSRHRNQISCQDCTARGGFRLMVMRTETSIFGHLRNKSARASGIVSDLPSLLPRL